MIWRMTNTNDSTKPESNQLLLGPRPRLQKISSKSVHNFLSNLQERQTNTDRHTDRQTEKQTERQRDRQTGRPKKQTPSIGRRNNSHSCLTTNMSTTKNVQSHMYIVSGKKGTNSILGITLTKFNTFSYFLA